MTTREERDTFSMMIDERVKQYGCSHMEAVIEYCEGTGLELEVAGSLVNFNLKAKIEEEARDLRYLPKGSKLPL